MSNESEKFLTIGEVIERIPFSRVHIYRLMARGDFPQRYFVGARRVAWKKVDIDNFIASRPRAD